MKKLILMMVCVSMILGASAASAFEPVAAKDLKVGFVYVGPVGDGGWTYMHDMGRVEMEEAFPGVESFFVESVAEGPDSVRVMETFIRNGAKLVFATSFGYMDFVQEVAAEPRRIFCTARHKRAPNGQLLRRMYQARYLSLAAGKMTKKNVIGFVAANPIRGHQGHQLLHAGARKVNPDVKVKVVWLFSWLTPVRKGSHLPSSTPARTRRYDADSGAAPQTAEEAGVYVVGYNNDMSHYAPTMHLTSPVWDWGMAYKYFVGKVIDGTWESNDIWWGLKEGFVGLSPISKVVPDEVVALVESEKAKIVEAAGMFFTAP